MRYLWKLLVRVGETRNLSRNWLETPPGCIIEFKKVGSRVARPTLVTFLIARKTLPYDVSLAKQQLLQIFLTLPSILNPSSFPFLHRAKFQRTIVSSIVDEFGGKENVNSKLGILDDSPPSLLFQAVTFPTRSSSTMTRGEIERGWIFLVSVFCPVNLGSPAVTFYEAGSRGIVPLVRSS